MKLIKEFKIESSIILEPLLVIDEEEQPQGDELIGKRKKDKKDSKKKKKEDDSKKNDNNKYYTVQTKKKKDATTNKEIEGSLFIKSLDLKTSEKKPKDPSSRRQEKLAKFFGTSKTDVTLVAATLRPLSPPPSSSSSSSSSSLPTSPRRPDIYDNMANVKIPDVLRKSHSDTIFFY